MIEGRDRARRAFLRLSPRSRQVMLRLARRRQPWDPKFDHRAPVIGGGLVTGPPDFVGVGVQKAGTTWWHDLLTRHPGCFAYPGLHKERHFLCQFWEGGFGPEDIEGYHRWFPRPVGKVTGEWSPDYLHHHWIPSILRRAAPEAKILVMLRDPVERYRSGIEHHLGQGLPVTSIVVRDAFSRGFCAGPLARLEAEMGADRMLVLQFEACRHSPRRFLADTYRFLGLDDSFVPHHIEEALNPTRGPRVDLAQNERARLADLYAEDVSRLVERYPQLDPDLWPSCTRF
ncbi:MAG TPA: sulfotransferase domain-containing protein [Acidimicrobiales bacterium]|nr:sulfotransferase domain-containing protein [Acidimicrobiales bacterium]